MRSMKIDTGTVAAVVSAAVAIIGVGVQRGALTAPVQGLPPSSAAPPTAGLLDRLL